MICKECGAYNPDHATYCKVCAANLKDNSEAGNDSSSNDTRATRTFIRPSWTVPAYTKSNAGFKYDVPEKKHEEKPDDETESYEENMIPEEETEEPVPAVSESDYSTDNPEDEQEEEEVEEAPVVSRKTVSKHSKHFEEYKKDDDDDASEEEYDDEEDKEDEEDEEEFVPVFHRSSSRKQPPVRLTEEDDEDLESDEDSDDEGYDEEDDDSYEYEPTPPKRKSSKKGNGPLFWILLVAIIAVILCIIVAGVLMLLRSSGNDVLNCSGTEPSKQGSAVIPSDNKGSSGDNTGNQPSSNEPSDEVIITESVNEKGEECVNFSNVIVPPHGVVTLVLTKGEQKYTSEYDVPVQYNLQVQKKAYYPDIPLDSPDYTVTPEIYVTETNGTTTTLKVPSFTLHFPTLTIDLQKPVANEEGIIMADKNNLLAISGLVDDFDVTVKINDEPVTVYTGGLFMYDYNMTAADPQTVTIYAEKANYVSTSTSITVNPYVYTPDKMVLTVSNDPITGVKVDKTGKLTITGTTLPHASLSASSDAPSRVVCGSVTVDDSGAFNFQVTMDSSFYGVSRITVNAEKEGAESGSKTFYVYRSYADRNAYLKAYNASKKYKEIGNGSKNVSYSALLANVATYATAEYGFRATAKVSEVVTGDDGYSYVRMTLIPSGETIYVLNLGAKWDPASNIGSNYNLYGNFLGTYTDGTSPLFAAFFAVNKK